MAKKKKSRNAIMEGPAFFDELQPFTVLHGKFMWGERGEAKKMVEEGDTVWSYRNLEQRYQNKFKLTAVVQRPTGHTGTPSVRPSAAKPTRTQPEAAVTLDDMDPTVKHEDPPSTPQGEDVTSQFKHAPDGIQVWEDPDQYTIWRGDELLIDDLRTPSQVNTSLKSLGGGSRSSKGKKSKRE